MRKEFRLLISICIFPVITFSQRTDTLVQKLDSLNRQTEQVGSQKNNISPGHYDRSTNLNVKTYFTLLGSDLKQGFTKPFHMTGKDWGKFAKWAVVLGGVALVDEPVQRFSVRLLDNNNGLQNFADKVTQFGGAYEFYTLAGFGAYGIIFKSDKMKTTTLLATQAYITGGALESVLKFISGRTRPSYYDAGMEPEPKFLGPFSKIPKNGSGKNVYSSFPSGHTTVAFAAATVFAKEYYDKPIVPIIAYSAATLIGLSRIAENVHWASDVFVGATLGYLAGREVVNNYHRFMKLKQPKKGVVSFTMQPFYGKLLPGIVYNFK